MNADEFKDISFEKIRVLNETLWEYKTDKKKIDRWLANFQNDDERLHALFLLSQFMYFGNFQMRELLKGLYRDLYKYRMVEKIRSNRHHTTDLNLIETDFAQVLSNTRFLGVGNPSESGTHLLYFFRQENKLPKGLFINISEIFESQVGQPDRLQTPEVKEYIFFDDFCGTGSQAEKYCNKTIDKIKVLDNTINTSYITLFATKEGKEYVRNNTNFDFIETVFELDESFRCFANNSRYFKDNKPIFIKKEFAESFCGRDGLAMMSEFWKKQLGVPATKIPYFAENDKLGFGDCQLLIGFHHNTPDNTLPIFWWDEEEPNWTPIFKRYNKIYG